MHVRKLLSYSYIHPGLLFLFLSCLPREGDKEINSLLTKELLYLKRILEYSMNRCVQLNPEKKIQNV